MEGVCRLLSLILNHWLQCIAVNEIEWEEHIERRRQKSPSTIDFLDGEQCKELEVDGVSIMHYIYIF